ncbi:sushi domain-containing protein 4-like [Clavelina lepadiformis]|uniref:sushi domain-containing protein 4-like n=1 Tax=Clavelina lepadiformis TaxID=159417 RepID=UPI004041E56F
MKLWQKWISLKHAVLLVLFKIVTIQAQGHCVDPGYIPEHGFRSPQLSDKPYFEKSVLRYSCDENYKLVPDNATQTCSLLDDGSCSWVPAFPPSCEKKTQCPDLIIWHGNYTGGLFYEGTTIHKSDIVCWSGYVLDFSPPTLTCLSNGEWSSGSNQLYCVEKNCSDLRDPENGSVKIYSRDMHNSIEYHTSKVSLQWPPDSEAIYKCDDWYQLKPDVNTRVCSKGNWSNVTPQCVSAYCTNPTHVMHGLFLCCLKTDSAPDDACCAPGGSVQFQCEKGYKVEGGHVDMECTENGVWSSQTVPKCVLDETTLAPPRSGSTPLSDDMVKTVVGVSTGVLGLLLVVIVLAFCKPHLKDIKRRWRDLREDENELIINGQRVILPTYEEATASNGQNWCDWYNQRNSDSHSSSESVPAGTGITRPPENNPSLDDVITIQASSSIDSPIVLNTNGFQGPGASVLPVPRPLNVYVNNPPRPSSPLPTPNGHSYDEDNPGPSGLNLHEVRGFEDDFVPVNDDSNFTSRSKVAASPTLSCSSNDSITAPLISSRQTRNDFVETAKTTLEHKKQQNLGDTSIESANSQPSTASGETGNVDFTGISQGLDLFTVSSADDAGSTLSLGFQLDEDNQRQADSTV